jgi:hypothetical protein
VTIALAFGLLKLQAAHQCKLAGSYMSHTYLGSQLAHYTLSYIESVKNCLLEYDLWQSASTFFQNCGPKTVLGEDSHFMTNWSLSSSFPFSLYLSVLPQLEYGSWSGSNLICCAHAFTLANLANLSLSLTFCWHVCNPSLNSNLLSFTIALPAFLTEQCLQIHEHGHCHHLLSQKQHFQAIY